LSKISRVLQHEKYAKKTLPPQGGQMYGKASREPTFRARKTANLSPKMKAIHNLN
jgi:hypothetical protein